MLDVGTDELEDRVQNQAHFRVVGLPKANCREVLGINSSSAYTDLLVRSNM